MSVSGVKDISKECLGLVLETSKLMVSSHNQWILLSKLRLARL
jgi:hypothetical protein